MARLPTDNAMTVGILLLSDGPKPVFGKPGWAAVFGKLGVFVDSPNTEPPIPLEVPPFDTVPDILLPPPPPFTVPLTVLPPLTVPEMLLGSVPLEIVPETVLPPPTEF